VRFSLLLLVLVLSCRSARAPSNARSADSTPRTFGESGSPLTYLVLGDSTAVGEGGDYEHGIAVETARRLALHHRVTLINVAVSGATTHDVLVDQLQRAQQINADIVLLDAGANDVTHLVSIRSAQRDLRTIVERLRQKRCDVRIVVTGSPDMSTPQRIPRLFRPLAGARTRRLNRLFERDTVQLGLTFAPIALRTGSLFRNDPTLFSPDRFHPSDRGYATWTAVINEALDDAMARPPSHCR
jgi:lysophospholipase L1-like esterase